MVRFSKLLMAAGVSMVIVGGGLHYSKLAIVSRTLAEASVTKTTSETETDVNVIPKVDSEALNAKIATLIAAHPELTVSIALTDILSNETYQYGNSDAYIAASTTKVLTAVMYLHEVETGTHTLNEYIDGRAANSLIKAMIVESNNDAWDSLRSTLHGTNLEAYAQSIGLTSFSATDNSITSADMTLLLKKIYTLELLNGEHTKYLLGFMEQSVRSYIAEGLPETVNVFHKAGWLSDRVHDTAIIEDGDNTYALTIFTKAINGTYNPAESDALFTQVAQTVHEVFSAIIRT